MNFILDSVASEMLGRFSVAISEKRQAKFKFRIGDEASGVDKVARCKRLCRLLSRQVVKATVRVGAKRPQLRPLVEDRSASA